MTYRLSKLAEYLSSENYQMAIKYCQDNPNQQPLREPQDVQLLLAKAYFVNEDYSRCFQLLGKLNDSRTLKIKYESQLLSFKAAYLMGNNPINLNPLIDILNKEFGNNNPYSANVMQAMDAIRLKGTSNQVLKSSISTNEIKQFEQLFKQEDDHSIVMEGMPMFLISARWYSAWFEFNDRSERIQKQKKHPGPITQFQITDHPFNFAYDPTPGKAYTNQYIFPRCRSMIMPKKCWQFLKDRYGGIDFKRYNISSIENPQEIMTEISLKKIEIGKYLKDKTGNPTFLTIQTTRKQTWQGVRTKMHKIWGVGEIYEFENGKLKAKPKDAEILQEVDIVDKKYVYVLNQVSKPTEPEQIQKCGYKTCNVTEKLKYCQCRAIKYCGMECLKNDRSNHRKKCDLQISHQKQESVVFKNFNLDEKDFGGRKGIVGLKNLGNSCYMNSGLQCLSNTKQITEYFMRDDFKNHINYSNPLGTKGNLACSYAQLIREMWTESKDVASPFKLKKIIGNYASQFSGFAQQDSQEFISYLIDGLQQDLNLVKKKQTFESSDDIKPDEQMSRQSEINYSKRIQAYIRSIMSGQFKSTVVCNACSKVSVCFDPYLLISLPIPTNIEWSFYFVPSDLSRGAIKFDFQYNNSTNLDLLSKQLATKYNERFNDIKDPRQKIVESQLLYITIHTDNFGILNVHKGNEQISTIRSSELLFCLQLPVINRDQELIIAEFQSKQQKFGFPRIFKQSKLVKPEEKERNICTAMDRGFEKGTKCQYRDVVIDEKIYPIRDSPFKRMVINCRKKAKLLTYIESFKQGFHRKLIQMQEGLLSLDDCLRTFTQKERLEGENSWYCNKCKDFKEATKQMEIYKSNKILVLAFKRFSRVRKVRTMVKFPVEGFNIGPYLLSNKNKQPIIYDLYGVVNHYGSLGGGHYTAYCQNFLNKRWYEFNDSQVSQITKKQISSGDSYVLFYRLRD